MQMTMFQPKQGHDYVDNSAPNKTKSGYVNGQANSYCSHILFLLKQVNHIPIIINKLPVSVVSNC